MHTPVLIQEVIEGLDIQSDEVYIDATAGEGGHIRAMLDKGAKVLAIDWDSDQIERLKKQLKNKNLQMEVGNFANIEAIAKEHGLNEVDGILFDLGLSMNQLSQSGRGFSYKYLEDPLDMRIDIRSNQTTADIVNTASADELYDMLARYGEDVHSEMIANAIVQKRIRHLVVNVGDMMTLLREVLDRCNVKHHHAINDTARRVFQALRMQVNQETENLKGGLSGAMNIIKRKGKIAVITFHSIEDRIVKQFVKENHMKYVKELVRHKSPKIFERSAKLRIFTKEL